MANHRTNFYCTPRTQSKLRDVARLQTITDLLPPQRVSTIEYVSFKTKTKKIVPNNIHVRTRKTMLSARF